MQKFRLRVRGQIVVKQIRSADDRDVIETTLQNAVDKINASNLTREEALLKVQQLRYNKNGANLTFSDRSRGGKRSAAVRRSGPDWLTSLTMAQKKQKTGEMYKVGTSFRGDQLDYTMESVVAKKVVLF